MNTWLKPNKVAVPLPRFVRSALQEFWIRYYFKYVLPKITETEIDGVKLDLAPFSPRIRNRIIEGYEEAEKQSCRALLQKNDRVLELGGGIGFVGLFCQKRLGIQQYVTIEANPLTIEILKRNYALNGLKPHVLNYAINDSNGTIDLNITGDFWEHSIEQRSLGATAPVPAITFPDLLEKLPIRPTTLIIDIEGAERFIDFRQIPEDITKIIIEIHPVIIGQPAVRRIVGSLCEKGFHIACEEGNTLAFAKST